MRITDRMLQNNALTQLQANVGRLAAIQEQVASTRRLNRPSDDPSQVRAAVKLRDSLAELDQYVRNIDTADETLSGSDAALKSSSEIIQRARELAVQGANDTLSGKDRNSIAVEVNQLIAGLLQETRAKSGDSYLFSGFRTDIAPYASAVGPYLGDMGAIDARVAPGATLQLNVTANVAFAPALAALTALQAELTSGARVSGATLTALDGGLDAIITARGQIGASQNRLEATRSYLGDGIFAAQKLLSGLEDADMTKVISEMAASQTSYEAALKVSAKVLSTTLLDYLR
jgi:flagellar hook-associated protein 3 FlgL